MTKHLIYILLFFLAAPAAVAQTEEAGLPIVVEDTVIVQPGNEDQEVFFRQTDPAELELSLRKVDSSLVERLKKDEDLNYGPMRPDEGQRAGEAADWTAPSWLRTLLWIIVVIAFLAIVIAFLYRTNAGIFKKKIRDEEGTDDDDFSENIFDINYDKEIRNAVAAGKYAVAIRLRYLQTLRNLSLAGLIEYRQERTNGDYVFHLFGSPQYKEFFALTRHYEYVWYGKFPVSSSAYQQVEKQFSDFNTSLPS